MIRCNSITFVPSRELVFNCEKTAHHLVCLFFFFNFVLFSWYCTNLSPHWLMFLVWQKSEVKYYTGPMFTLHQINAFEDSEFLVMDMCCGDDGELIGEFTLENLRRNSGEEIDEVNALSLLVCYQWTAQIEMLAFTKTTTWVTST